MLLRPINAYPSNNVSVDANEDVVFYSMIEGSASIVSKYRYIVYDAYTHDVLYQQTVDLSSNPLIAGDELKYTVNLSQHGVTNNRNCYWRLRLYQDIADMFVTNSVIQKESAGTTIYIRAHNNVEAGMYLNINGVSKLINEYSLSEDGTMGICVIESEFTEFTVGGNCTIYKNYVDSLQFPFYTQPTPTLTISADGVKDGIISTRKLNFTLEYSALHEMPIKWYRIVVTDADTGKVFDDSDKVYNSGLSYQSEGFLNEHTYSVVGYVFNSNNMLLATSNECIIQAQYHAPSMAVIPRLEQNKIDDSVIVSWDQDRVSVPVKLPGAVETFTDDGMLLEGNAIIYNTLSSRPLDLGDAWTIFVDATISNINSGNIIKHNDSGSRIYIDANTFKYDDVNGNSTILDTVLDNITSGQADTPVTTYKVLKTKSFQDNMYINQLMSMQYCKLNLDMRGKIITLVVDNVRRLIRFPSESTYDFSANTSLTFADIARLWETAINSSLPRNAIKVDYEPETSDLNASTGKAKLIIKSSDIPASKIASMYITPTVSAFDMVYIPTDGVNYFDEDITAKVFLGATEKTIDITINGITKTFSIYLTLKELCKKVTDLYDDFVMYIDYLEQCIILGALNSNIKNITVSDNLTLFHDLMMGTEVQSGKALAPNTNYIWMDDTEWEDMKYWVETPAFKKRYKITMQPKYAQLTEVI